MMKRCKEPDNEGVKPISRIEIDFHMPVYMDRKLQHALHDAIAAIVNDLKNQPLEGVHWLAGSGSKPRLSQADAIFMGKTPDAEAPESGEPTFDDSILYFETFSRGFVSVDEAKRAKERRALGLA